MTQIEFETLKTVITSCDQLPNLVEMDPMLDDTPEFPNLRDRLKDGANLIDLYIEWMDWDIWMQSFKNALQEEQDFWDAAEEVLVEPDEKKFVFALCTPGGSFEDMIVLKQSEIISENTDEDDEGIYHLKFQINGEEDSSYFLSKEEL